MRNKFYLKEFQFFDGEDTVVFNIVALENDKITVIPLCSTLWHWRMTRSPLPSPSVERSS